MKKGSLIRLTGCLLVLLSFVGASLFQDVTRAQERGRQEGEQQERRSKKQKAKEEKGGISPNICYDCDPEPPPPPPPPPPGGGGGDGHIWCDGWDRQGACVFQLVNPVLSATFRRQMGNNGYDFQTYLTWFPQEIDGFGRFPLADGNVGLVSTSPAPGQIPLHRWSTRRGFYYSIYFNNHGGDYVYGGIAAYVWPPGDNRGFPLYQFYSHEYGHYYTNYKREINCQPDVTWDDQGEMARVNFPAPFAQAFRNCGIRLTFPQSCDPFFAERCRQQGGVFNFTNCSCNPF